MKVSERAVVATAPGKVNLSLRVGGVDDHGYHALATVFHAVDLLETVEACPPKSPGELTLSLDSRVRGHVPVDSSNLALKAAELLRAHTGTQHGAALHITKRVPIAGGMGGGSADAAASLVALNRLWELDLDQEELLSLGARLGADVPFALLGGTALGTGNGAVLEPVVCEPKLTWVMVVPGGHLSTPEVFRMFDRIAAERGHAPATMPTPDALQIEALMHGDAAGVARTLSNDLQEAAMRLHDGLAPTMRALDQAGATACIVSGSGPTMAALVSDAETARAVQHHLRTVLPDVECLICTGAVPGARILEER